MKMHCLKKRKQSSCETYLFVEFYMRDVFGKESAAFKFFNVEGCTFSAAAFVLYFHMDVYHKLNYT